MGKYSILIKETYKHFVKKTVIYILNSYANLLNKNSRSKKILIVKPDAIGDFIIFSKFLNCYIELYREYDIDIAINKINEELINDCDDIKKIVLINKNRYYSNIIYRYKLFRRILKSKYEKVIYPAYSREDIGEYITIFSGSKEKIGINGNYDNISFQTRNITDKLYTKLFQIDDKAHEEIKNKEFLIQLGFEGNNYNSFISINNKAIKAVDKLLFQNIKNKYICFVPGAGTPNRYWGAENNSMLLNKICKEFDYSIVICGSKNEEKIVRDILDNLDKNAVHKIINLTGMTNLHELAYIISESKLYIGSETSSLHLAELYKIPSICLLGGGHFGRFYPYPQSEIDHPVSVKLDCFCCGWKCTENYVKCIKDIRVEQIINEIINI